jgi:hypothetical protein
VDSQGFPISDSLDVHAQYTRSSPQIHHLEVRVRDEVEVTGSGRGALLIGVGVNGRVCEIICTTTW